MKRLFVLLLIGVLTFTLCACGSKSGSGAGNDAEKAAQESSEELSEESDDSEESDNDGGAEDAASKDADSSKSDSVSKDAKADDTAKSEDDSAETVAIRVNTEGIGQIAYAKKGKKVKFSDDKPIQSAVINAKKGEKYTLAARGDEDFEFLGWTKNGKEFSTDEDITVKAVKDVEYVAMFELAE